MMGLSLAAPYHGIEIAGFCAPAVRVVVAVGVCADTGFCRVVFQKLYQQEWD